MESALVSETRALLRNRGKLTLHDVAAKAGVKYDWLTKFSQGRFSNPGAGRVERVRDFLRSTE